MLVTYPDIYAAQRHTYPDIYAAQRHQTKTAGGHRGSWNSQLRKVPCDSLALEEGLNELSTKMQSEFSKWVEKFITTLNSSDN